LCLCCLTLSLQKGARAAELRFHKCRSRQTFCVQRIFAWISPNLSEKLLYNFCRDILPTKIIKTFFGVTFKKRLHAFFCKPWAPFYEVKQRWAPFFSKSKLWGCPCIPWTPTSNIAFHNSIIGDFMAYQDWLEINLLQLLRHPEKSQWFSRKFRMIISVIIFEVNIVDEQKQNIFCNDFFVFYTFPLPSTVWLLPLPYRCSGVPEYASYVNKLHQNVGCEREYDVLLWHHKH